MSNEQNIDDILKLLKSSVSDDSSSEQVHISEDKPDDMNDEVLKSRLKMQYLENDSSDSKFDFFDSSDDDGYNSYSIDDEFMSEATADEDLSDEVEEEKEEQETQEAFVFFEPADTAVSSDEDDLPWDDVIDDIVAEVEYSEQTEDNKIEYDEASLFELPDELVASVPTESEVGELDDGSDADEDETTFEDIELRGDDETLVNVEDYEIFDEPATFSLYDSDNPTADATELEAIDNDESGDVQTVEEQFNDIVIDSTETSKALDFDVYAPHVPVQDPAPDIYTLFKEEKAKQNVAAAADNAEEQAAVDSVDESENAGEAIADSNTAENMEALDFSEMSIMLQLGFEDELRDTVGEEKVEDFVRYDVADREKQRVESEKRKIDARPEKLDYVSPDQNDSIKERYKAEGLKSLIKLIGVVAIALLIGFIEMMPILNARLEGILDYNAYPALYMLFGSQLLILAAVVVYKSMISGLVYAFSSRPTRHSSVALALAMTILYDIIMILIVSVSQEDYPPMFNGVAALLLVISAAVDYVMIISEKKTFNVYSFEDRKYTLTDDSEKGRIKEKLLRGGIDSTKNVYIPESIDFPRGFKQLCRTETEWKLTRIFTIPVFVLSILAIIVNMSLSRDTGEIAGALMMTFLISMPIITIVAETLPCFIATRRLEKRGSAVAGSEMFRKYAECDIIAFKDTYLFEKCKAEELGIAIYDTSVGYLALGCFKALYDKIGGPLSDLNIDLPDVFKFDDVRIRRISKNGIDAVIDGRHSLLAGDHAFMQRYGLSFPKSESDSVRGAGVLCLSLNQKVTAKISVKYNTVELFEMLAERLAQDGVTPIITTADPLINSAIINKNRKLGDSPIGVVHKNSADLEATSMSKNKYDPDGIVSCMSSLKLAETLVWCKRVEKIRHICQRVVSIFSIAGILFSVFAVILGISQYINQAMISLYLLLELVIVGAVTFMNIPDKEYFSVRALREEILAEEQEQKSEAERAAAKTQNTPETIEEEDKPKEKSRSFKLGFLKLKNSKNRKKDQDEQ